MDWNVYNILSVILSIYAHILSCALIKKSLKNWTFGSIWSQQRLLRFSTAISLLIAIIGYTIYIFTYALQSEGKLEKHSCDGLRIIAIVGSSIFGISYPTSLVFATLTTINRYTRLNILDGKRRISINLFIGVLIFTAVINGVCEIWYSFRPCYWINDFVGFSTAGKQLKYLQLDIFI